MLFCIHLYISSLSVRSPTLRRLQLWLISITHFSFIYGKNILASIGWCSSNFPSIQTEQSTLNWRPQCRHMSVIVTSLKTAPGHLRHDFKGCCRSLSRRRTLLTQGRAIWRWTSFAACNESCWNWSMGWWIDRACIAKMCLHCKNAMQIYLLTCTRNITITIRYNSSKTSR